MNAPTSGARRYNDEEMSRLLRRAVELHQADASDSGLTLEELEEVAREAGIGVGALHRAASELDDSLPRMGGLAGAPMSIRLERTLPLEATADGLEAVIPLLQSASTTPGRANVTARTLAWRTDSMQSMIDRGVLVSVRNGETRIQIEERYGRLAGTIFGAGVGGIGSGVGFGVGAGVGVAIGSALMIVAFPIFCLGLSYVACRALFGSLVRQRVETLQELLNTLTAELRVADEPVDSRSETSSSSLSQSHA
jgi:hypothetical protein